MVAVALEHWMEGAKDDPRYIQWVAILQYFVDGVETLQFYPTHTCTDEDFSRFYPVEGQSAIKVQALRAQGQFKCADLTKSTDIHGSWRTDDTYTAFEIGLFACATRIEMADGSSSGGHDECEWDHQKVREYLGMSPTAIILYNQVEFNSKEYGADRLEKKAKLRT